MSVPSIISKASYVYNGTTRTFDFGFRIVSEDDLIVRVNGTPLTKGTNYSVTGVNYYEGGTITIASGYSMVAGDAVVISRKVAAYTQETVFRNQGAFYAESVEDALDKLTMMSQEMKLKIDLLPSYPDADVNLDLTFPYPSETGFFRWATRQIGTPAVTEYYIDSGPITSNDIFGVITIEKGGTGQSNRQAAINALAGTQSSGLYLRSDGTNTSLNALLAADLTGTLAISKGGTGGATQAAAWTGIGMPQAGTSLPVINATSASAGTSDKWSRQDHQHPTDTSRLAKAGDTMTGALIISSGGLTVDASGIKFSDNSVQTVAVSAGISAPLMNGTAAVGTSALYARQDHVHPTDTSRLAVSQRGAANGVCPLNASSQIDSTYLPSYVDDVVEVSTLPGTGETGKIYVRTTDNTTHRWTGSVWVAITSGGTPSGTASGDLSGSYPGPTVAKIQGRAVTATAPTTTGQALVWNQTATQYEPTAVVVSSSVGTANGVCPLDGTGKVSTTYMPAPTGTASGDLSGSYPGPTVAKIRGVTVSTTAPTNGQALVYNSSTSQYAPVATFQANQVIYGGSY